MASAAQIAANRANAQKSTGPTSAEGKLRSSANATTHGLTGLHTFRTPAEHAAFAAFTERLIPDLNPSTELQLEIARRIIYTMFRLAQVPVIEANIYAHGRARNVGATDDPEEAALLDALAQARTFLEEGKTINNLALYEQRLSRSMHKDLDFLRKLQKEAHAQLAPARQPRPEATRPVVQPIDSKAQTPGIGFVYATPQTAAAPPDSAASNAPEKRAA